MNWPKCGAKVAAVAGMLLSASCAWAGMVEWPVCTHAMIQARFPGKQCSYEQVNVREGGEMRPAALARVVADIVLRTDVPSERFAYFLVMQDEAVDLGEFRAWLPQPQSSPVFTMLGYEGAWSGGLMSVDVPLFFDAYIERRQGEYCLVHRLKHPFAGEVARCGAGISGSAMYAPGVLSWREAGERICQKAAAETGSACRNGQVERLRNRIIRSEATGQAVYEITTRGRIRACPELTRSTLGLTEVPVEYELRRYRMEMDGSGVKLLDILRQPCQ